jgi:hypothetical protein
MKNLHPSQRPAHLRREKENKDKPLPKKTDGDTSLEMEKLFGFRPIGMEW